MTTTPKSASGRKHPRVYCRFGEGDRLFYRFCPTKPFPENGVQELRQQIKDYFASFDDSSARRAVARSVSVKFRLGKDGKDPLAGAVNVVEGNEGVFFAQDNLRLHMEQAWQAARTQLGIQAAA